MDSATRINELYQIANEQTNLGDKSDWLLPELPSSYLLKGHCRAALKSYQEFLELKNGEFTWVPIHLELAEKLGEYQDRSGELVEILKRMKKKGLPTIPLDDGKDEPVLKYLEELDPFTFYSNFNRGVTDENRKEMWRMVKEELNLSSEVPSNFDGLPTYNMQNARLFWHAPDRDEDHIPLLWEFFAHVLTTTPEELDLDMMDPAWKNGSDLPTDHWDVPDSTQDLCFGGPEESRKSFQVRNRQRGGNGCGLSNLVDCSFGKVGGKDDGFLR